MPTPKIRLLWALMAAPRVVAAVDALERRKLLDVSVMKRNMSVTTETTLHMT